MEEPKITVMIPVFNMKDTIGRAIESVLNQSYNNKELMVLDGGSTDGTLDVIKLYVDRIDYFISQHDRGPSDAMASNIQYATGDLITMIGADDWYNAGALEEAARVYIHSAADVVYGDCEFIYSDGTQWRKCARTKSLENLFYYNCIFSIAAFVKIELLKEYYRTYWIKINSKINVSTDHYLWLLLYCMGKQFVYIESKKALTNYFVAGRSTVNEYEGSLDDEEVLKLVTEDNSIDFEKYKVKFKKFFAARTILCYEKTAIKLCFEEEVKKYIHQNDRYVIFGVGDMGRKAVRLLELSDTYPEYFIDNNWQVNQQGYMGRSVFAPQRLRTEKNLIVLVAILECEERIGCQITDLKLDPSVKVIYYSDLCEKIQETLGRQVLEKAWRNGDIK